MKGSLLLKLNIFFLAVVFLSCTSKGQIIEYRENFLQVSIKPEWTEAVCEGDANATFFGVYAVLDGILYDFFFRRPLNRETCLKRLSEYKFLTRGALRIDLIGIEPSLSKHFDEAKVQNPKHLGKYDKKIAVIFVRAHGNGRCMSYFTEDCNPSKYWGGVIPGKKMTK